MAQTTGIYWLADRMAPTLRRQFLGAVHKVRASVTVDMIWQRRIDEAIQRMREELNPTVSTLAHVFGNAEERATHELGARIGARFDIINPLAVEAAWDKSSLLIRQITEETRRAIQRVTATAIVEGIPPREAARIIKPMIGLTSRQAQAVMNYRGMLLGAGMPIEKVVQLSARYADRKLSERATTIARTEGIRAANDGQQSAWEQAASQGLIDTGRTRRVWIAAEDERVCPICGALDETDAAMTGYFGLKLKRRVAGTVVFSPPAHPRCRCTMVLRFVRATRQRLVA